MTKVVTRFPPSPTGYFHIGSARTALFNFLYSKKEGGEMLFRFEDTDKERSQKEYEWNILDSMKWLGISYDGEIVKQSDRTEIYKKYLMKMIGDGSAFFSKEESKKEAGQMVEVVRFKNPNKKIKFEDIVRGEIEFDTTELGDFVIAKNLDEPLYHLSVVIDDFLMGVTHVIRGEDHISNTPRQILIGEVIGAQRPIYAHIPLILAPDRSKLSKRHGAVSLMEYRGMGYLPEALINYLALLGWNPGTDEEIFTMDELVEKFDISRVQKGGAIFSTEKLDWINKEHLKRKSWEEVEAEIIARLNMETGLARRLAPTIFERINKYGDIDIMRDAGELEYYYKAPTPSAKDLIWKKSAKGASGAIENLNDIIRLLEDLDENTISIDTIKEKIFPYADERGRGEVLWPMRYALSGQERSPDPFTLTYILGREETIKRLRAAISILTHEANPN
jgi:glutamyl-tRNA synthetase